MSDQVATPNPKSISPEESLKFLIACIKYADNGKINFDHVAQECDIVSKGAAAKRYERLLKAHGVNPANLRSGSSKPADGTSPVRKKRTPAKKATPIANDDGAETSIESPNAKKAKLDHNVDGSQQSTSNTGAFIASVTGTKKPGPAAKKRSASASTAGRKRKFNDDQPVNGEAQEGIAEGPAGENENISEGATV